MSTTLALDASKGLFLSPALLELAQWNDAESVSVEIGDGRIVVTPVVEKDAQKVQLIRKRGRMVIEGLGASSDADVIASIKAGRDQHDNGVMQDLGA
ncbi:hypothetical protein [Prosthecobacter sp.]|uniref:hypothetical protein n=1 Tax=Prosthecobacter sp. TaxID=1965333 RepID=UPI0037846E0B